jgi:hypothetical protein
MANMNGSEEEAKVQTAKKLTFKLILKIVQLGALLLLFFHGREVIQVIQVHLPSLVLADLNLLFSFGLYLVLKFSQVLLLFLFLLQAQLGKHRVYIVIRRRSGLIRLGRIGSVVLEGFRCISL